jgi:hypothetical protein
MGAHKQYRKHWWWGSEIWGRCVEADLVAGQIAYVREHAPPLFVEEEVERVRAEVRRERVPNAAAGAR